LLELLNVSGERGRAGEERGILAHLSRRNVHDRLVPLLPEQLSRAGTASPRPRDAAGTAAHRADVLEPGGVSCKLCDVGVVPARGGGADEDFPHDRGRVGGRCICGERSLRVCGQRGSWAAQVEVSLVVEGERTCTSGLGNVGRGGGERCEAHQERFQVC